MRRSTTAPISTTQVRTCNRLCAIRTWPTLTHRHSRWSSQPGSNSKGQARREQDKRLPTKGASLVLRLDSSGGGDACGELGHRILRIAEEHHGLRVLVQRVVDAGKPGVHAALEDDDIFRLVDVQNGHAVDGAVG